MVVVPDAPRVPRQAGSPGFFNAGNVAAPQDFTGKQLTGLGDAMQVAGEAVYRRNIAEVQKINRSRARDASARVGSSDIDSIFSLRELKGQAGIDAAPQALEDFHKRSDAARDALDNDEQRAAFDEKRQSDFLSFKSQVEGYRAQQIDFEDKVTTAASLAQAKNSAVAYHNTITDPVVGFDQDPQNPPRPTAQQQFDASNAKRMEAVIAEAYYMAQREGITDRTALEVFIRAHTTEVHAQIASDLLENASPVDAAQYLDTNKSQIDAPVMSKLVGKVRQGSIAAESLDIMFGITEQVAGTGDNIDQQVAAMQAAEDAYKSDKISAEVYDSLTQRIGRHYSQKDQAESASERQTVTEAETWLANNQNKILTDNPDLYERAAATGNLPALLSFQENGRHTTDPAIVAELERTPIELLAKIPADRFYTQFYGSLSPQEMDRWQRKIVASQTDDAKLRHVVTVNDRINRAWHQLNPQTLGRTLNGPEQAMKEEWEANFDAEVVEWQAQHKRKPTDLELQGLLDQKVGDKVRVENSILWKIGTLGLGSDFEEVPLNEASTEQLDQAYVLTTDQSMRVRISDIKTEHWGNISDFLRSVGKRATVQNIVDRWVEIGMPDRPIDSRETRPTTVVPENIQNILKGMRNQ